MSRQQVRQILSTDVTKAKGNIPSISEQSYLVQIDETLRILRFTGGHEYTGRNARLSLLVRDGAYETLLAVVYGSGCVSQINIDVDVVGNGTREIVLQAFSHDTTSDLHMTCLWEGIIL